MAGQDLAFQQLLTMVFPQKSAAEADETINPLSTISDHQNMTNATFQHCVAGYNLDNFALIIFPTTIITIFGLSFTVKGDYTMCGACKNRPTIPYPISFLFSSKGRLRYCLAMVLLGAPLYSLVQNFGTSVFSTDASFLALLRKIVTVLLYGLALHPTLFGITKQSVLSITIAMIKPLFILTVGMFALIHCAGEVPRYTLEVEVIFEHLPSILASAALIACLAYDLVRALLRKQWVAPYKNYSAIRKCMEDRLTYTRMVFSRPKQQETQGSYWARLKEAFTYRSVPGFRYSTVVLCSYSLCLTLLYFFTWHIIKYPLVLRSFSTALSSRIPTNDTRTIEQVFEKLVVDKQFQMDRLLNGSTADLFHVLSYVTSTMSACVATGIILATMNEVASIALMFVAYRANVLSAYRGCYKATIPLSEFGANRAITGSIRYVGYQVTYASWAWLLQAVMYTIVVAFLWFTVIMPLVFGYDLWFINTLYTILPVLVLLVLVMKVQQLVNRHVFTVEKGKYLAVNHRRLYLMWNYYCFLANTMIGIASCLLRLLIAFVLTFVLMGRLDYCSLPQRFRFFDSGFIAYVAQVHVDVNFSHPLVQSFIHILQQAARNRRMLNASHLSLTSQNEFDGDDVMIIPRDRNESNGASELRGRMLMLDNSLKWHLAYTLIRNPKLIGDRRQTAERASLYQVRLALA